MKEKERIKVIHQGYLKGLLVPLGFSKYVRKKIIKEAEKSTDKEYWKNYLLGHSFGVEEQQIKLRRQEISKAKNERRKSSRRTR